MPQVPPHVYPIASAIVSFLLGWFLFKILNVRKHGQAQVTCDRLLEDARKEAAPLPPETPQLY